MTVVASVQKHTTTLQRTCRLLRPLVLGCAPQLRSGRALQHGTAAGTWQNDCRVTESAVALQERAIRHMLRPPTRLQLAEWQATSFMLNVSIHCSSAASPEGKVQLCLIKNSCL